MKIIHLITNLALLCFMGVQQAHASAGLLFFYDDAECSADEMAKVKQGLETVLLRMAGEGDFEDATARALNGFSGSLVSHIDGKDISDEIQDILAAKNSGKRKLPGCCPDCCFPGMGSCIEACCCDCEIRHGLRGLLDGDKEARQQIKKEMQEMQVDCVRGKKPSVAIYKPEP